MLKLFLLILTGLSAGYCFCQPTQNNDSTIKTSDTISVSKNTVAINVNSTTLRVYPNPAKNKITLNVAGFEPGMVVVKITDTKGKLWRADNRLLTNGTEEITMFLLLQPGVYFISVSEKSKVVKKKIIIL